MTTEPRNSDIHLKPRTRKLDREFLRKLTPKQRELLRKKIQQQQAAKSPSESPPRSSQNGALPATKPEPVKKQEKSPPKSVPMRSGRTSSTRVLPGFLYDQSRLQLRKRNLRHSIGVILLVLFMTSCFYFYFRTGAQKQEIIAHAVQGLMALEMGQSRQAKAEFQLALTGFRNYQPEPGLTQWNRDAGVYTHILDIAEGFRRLGLYREALESIRQVAVRNVEGQESWLGKRVSESLRKIVTAEEWQPSVHAEIYEYLLALDPQDWGQASVLLVLATEIAGLQKIPIAERYQKADVTVYGTPEKMHSTQERRFQLKGLTFYRIDHLPGTIEFQIPDALSAKARQRLLWYSQSGRNVIVFAKKAEVGFQITGMEDIILSDVHSVEPFNQVVLREERTEVKVY